MAVLQQSIPLWYCSKKIPSHFLHFYFLPTGDHSLANDSSLAPTAQCSSNTGQPSAKTRIGMRDHLILQWKKLKCYNKHWKGGQLGWWGWTGNQGTKKRILPQLNFSCTLCFDLIIQTALYVLPNQILHQNEFKKNFCCQNEYLRHRRRDVLPKGNFWLSYGARATIFPFHSLQGKKQNDIESCSIGTIHWKLFDLQIFLKWET